MTLIFQKRSGTPEVKVKEVTVVTALEYFYNCTRCTEAHFSEDYHCEYGYVSMPLI